MSHHKVEIRSLNFSYPDGHEAIRNLSFTIYHGESVGVIGANGAGKSTLLQLIMGILMPDSGEIVIGDIQLTKKTLRMIRERVGMVFQDPNDQLFMTTVRDDVAFGPRNYRLEETEITNRVNDALAQVGISHLVDRAPFRLSGGERRVAAIATVLSMKPDILIMDEPTSSLDPLSRRRVMGILNGFKHTKIITSHDLDMIFATCQRVIAIKDGSIAADGNASDILQNQLLLEQCGLEMPIALQSCPVCGSSKQNIE